MMPRVMFYVQHLLGIGHIVRSTRIARALAQAGFDVTLVCGGLPLPGLDPGTARVTQLPPVTAGPAGFGELVDANGQALDEIAKATRSAALLREFDRISPDILLIEAFPFGRRQMRFELLPLLHRAKNVGKRPLIVSSVRDILQAESGPGRAEGYAELVEEFFDLVLVHGDEALVSFSASFRLAHRIEARLRHTGIVGPGETIMPHDRHDVIVSAGGGAVGQGLLRAALAARPLTQMANAKWLFVTGPNMGGEITQQIEIGAVPNVEIRRFLPDLPARLKEARISISQAGYNTVADILSAGCAAVLVPFGGGGETEQTQRAELLEARGFVRMVSEDSMNAHSLMQAIDAALLLPKPKLAIKLDGALKTAELLRSDLRHRTSPNNAIGGSKASPENVVFDV